MSNYSKIKEFIIENEKYELLIDVKENEKEINNFSLSKIEPIFFLRKVSTNEIKDVKYMLFDKVYNDDDMVLYIDVYENKLCITDVETIKGLFKDVVLK